MKLNFINKYKCSLFIAIVLIVFSFTSCGKRVKIVDPVSLGFSTKVYYNALGGTINKREIRETFYEPGSLLFMPSGTSNMLIEPIREGYLLAAWYTSKTDIFDENGAHIGYSFRPEDRWDFTEDRVSDDLTLYARWIPQGKADYIDAKTGAIMFTKNISDKSPVLALTSAAENLIKKKGYTFEGYFADEKFSEIYNFSGKKIDPFLPTANEIEAKILEIDPNINLSKLSESQKHNVRAIKNEIYESYIQNYEANTQSQKIFLKYDKGIVVHVSSPEDLRYQGQIGFSGLNADGEIVDRYIINKDIDFKGASLVMGESFSGKIIGNGHSLKNISLVLNSKPLDKDKEKKLSLFDTLENASIEDIVFENFIIKITANAGVKVMAAPLAITAHNTSLKNISFNNLQIDTGKSDDGTADYLIGDLFVSSENLSLNNVKASAINFKLSQFAKVHRLLK